MSNFNTRIHTSTLLFVIFINLGGAAVDPVCVSRLGHNNFRVFSSCNLELGYVWHSVILIHVNIRLNKNSYYRMQLLESNPRDM